MNYFLNQKGAITLMTFIIVFMVIVVLIIVGDYFLIANRTGEPERSVSREDNNITDSEISSSRDEEKTSEYTYSFLKLENESTKKQNIIYSPLSIKYALKLLSDGANGNTKKEIDRLIGKEGITKYKNIDKILSLANAVYIKDTHEDDILDSYIDNAKKNYDAEVRYDSFEDAKNINEWVSEKTFNVINNFLKDSQVQDSNLVMILVNALGVDMKWKTEFSEYKTVPGQFDNKDGESIKTAYMHKSKVMTDDIAYKLDDDTTILTMDLEENEGIELEFDAIMPNNMELDEFISKLDNKKVESLLSNLTNASETEDGVNVTIPRFDFDYSIAFKEELKELGINDAFSMSADFSNITGNKSIFVGDAIHKADISFTEKGVKAAAATAVVMLEKSIAIDESYPIDVVIDKPFMFVIRDKDTGEVWFTGTVYEPTLWDDVEEEYDR